MQFKDMLEQILKEKKMTQVAFAEMVGTTQPAIGNARKRNDVYVSTLIKWCNALGYEVVIQEIKPGRRKDGQIVLSAKEE